MRDGTGREVCRSEVADTKCGANAQPPIPMDKESFMKGHLGLGMAIPEEATAELGPLPHLIPTITREQRDAEVRGSGSRAV